MDKKKKNLDFKDISKDYIVEASEEIYKQEIKSSDIKEDRDGNCIIQGHKIEANACSMLKDDYKI